jgi:hypothetical protein
VTAFDKFQRCLALAYAAVSHHKQALAVYFDKNAVEGRPGREIEVQPPDELGHELRCVALRAEQVDVILLRRFEALGKRLLAAGYDKAAMPLDISLSKLPRLSSEVNLER